jgi:hypothetical protein
MGILPHWQALPAGPAAAAGGHWEWQWHWQCIASLGGDNPDAY